LAPTIVGVIGFLLSNF